MQACNCKGREEGCAAWQPCRRQGSSRQHTKACNRRQRPCCCQGCRHGHACEGPPRPQGCCWRPQACQPQLLLLLLLLGQQLWQTCQPQLRLLLLLLGQQLRQLHAHTRQTCKALKLLQTLSKAQAWQGISSYARPTTTQLLCCSQQPPDMLLLQARLRHHLLLSLLHEQRKVRWRLTTQSQNCCCSACRRGCHAAGCSSTRGRS